MCKSFFQTLFLLGLISTAFCAQKQNIQDTNFLASIIGKEFSNETEISDSIRDSQVGFVCEKDTSFLVGVFVQKSNKKHRYLLLTQKLKSTDKQKIRDAIEVDLEKFKKGTQIKWEYCTEIHKKINDYIAVYNPEDGDSIVPEKVWVPNVVTGKFDSLNVKDFSCYSEPNGDEE